MVWHEANNVFIYYINLILINQSMHHIMYIYMYPCLLYSRACSSAGLYSIRTTSTKGNKPHLSIQFHTIPYIPTLYHTYLHYTIHTYTTPSIGLSLAIDSQSAQTWCYVYIRCVACSSCNLHFTQDHHHLHSDLHIAWGV